jgi:superfamily I DNA/RNA helicase
MKPTQEQQLIIDSARQRQNLAITAFAGAAKTTTCSMIAKELTRPSLYIAFNKSIATEASEKFPIHVDCKTLHSLAYADIITPNKMYKKVSGFIDTKEVIQLLDKQLESVPDHLLLEIVYTVLDVIRFYCQSAEFSLEEFSDVYLSESSTSEQRNFLRPLVVQVWTAMISKSSSLKMTHDVYLKLFQLSKPVLDQYEVIYLDEAQDSNPVSLDIFYRQTHAQLVMVGDPYQSIYEWRGAVNAFDTVPASFVRKQLSESFRFTSEIAELATKLTSIAGNNIAIKGLAEKNTIRSTAIICRTNASILQYLLSAVQNREKVFVLADLQDLWSKMYHISALAGGAKPRYPNKSLVGFNSFDELRVEAEHSAELKKLLNLGAILASGKGTHANIVSIKEVIVENVEEANYTITTCHKSKGLEWDYVKLDEDMLYVDEEEDYNLVDLLKAGQTLNLLYVAVTRAKYSVKLPQLVQEVISSASYLRAEW